MWSYPVQRSKTATYGINKYSFSSRLEIIARPKAYITPFALSYKLIKRKILV